MTRQGTHSTRLEQLKAALDAGLIDQDTYDTAVAGMSAARATRFRPTPPM